MRSPLALLATLAALAGPARAEVCPPAVTLAGDAALLAPIAGALASRGIALDRPECPAVAARVEARDGALVVDVGGVERVVGDPATAATVIESWSRADVTTPLLAVRAIRRPAPSPAVDERAPAAAPASRGLHVFGAFETSFASDHTRWLGGHVGVCVTLGPVCAAARLRLAAVAGGPGPWDRQLERHGTELLVGLDVPFTVRGVTATPGFAAGLGQMRTRDAATGAASETGGPRADVHTTVSIPIAARFAIDVFAAIDLTQETRVEWWSEMAPLPDEPRALLRIGAGLRYGGR